jgi:WD40 repeat protein
VLQGNQATCYRYGEPKGVYIERLKQAGAIWLDKPVVRSGSIITGRGPGDAKEFVAEVLRAVREEEAKALSATVLPFNPRVPAEGQGIRLGGKVQSVAFSPDGRLFAAGVAERLPGAAEYPDGAVVWERATGAVVAHLWRGQEVLDLAFERDGRALILAGKKGTADWDFSMRQAFPCAEGKWGAIRTVATSPDGSRVAAGYWDGACQGQIDEWKRPGGSNARKLGQGAGWSGVRQLVYSADNALAAAYEDGRVRFWLPGETEPLPIDLHAPDRKPAALAFAPDRPLLAIAASGVVRLWTHHGRTRVGQLPTGKVQAVTFTADGKHLVTAGPGRDVILWEASTGKPVRTLKGHGDAVLSLALAPDGRVLATGDESGEARLWDLDAARNSKPEGR